MNLEEAKKIPKLYEAYLKQINNNLSLDVLNFKKENKNGDKHKGKKEDSNTLLGSKVKNKHGNNKITNTFGTFDSQLEFKHYLILSDICKNKGFILNKQVRFVLLEGFETKDKILGIKKYQPLTYIADFVVSDKEGNNILVIDSKGFKTEKFMIKMKLFANKFGRNLLLLNKDTSITYIEGLFDKLTTKN